MPQEKPEKPPLQAWIGPVALGWLLPGGGHLYLKRWNRGALLLFAVVGMFVFGLLMRGKMFEPADGDLFTIALNYGGYFFDLANGAPYFLTTWLGYSQADLPGAVSDYGTKFLVCAGLLNILAILDAYEIAVGRKS